MTLRTVRRLLGGLITALLLGAHFDAGATTDEVLEFAQWMAAGNAFDDQPTLAAAVTTDREIAVPLGGDYWRGLSYPLGQEGRYLIDSAFAHGEAGVGTFTSPPFAASSARPYFRALIGGSNEVARERVELLVQVSPGEQARLSLDLPASAGRDLSSLEGDWLVVWAETGRGYDSLEQHVIKLPPALFGRVLRVRIVDASSGGHIAVDGLAWLESEPPIRPPVVWGYADYHTHPMSHLAFGGLKGLRTIWGVPGGNVDDYTANPSLVNDDLPRCERGHGGGPYANPFLNAAQRLQYAATADLLLSSHPKAGAPEFSDVPSFLGGAHEQMHVTQIRRNYEGGLRLMVALATENLGAEYLMSKVQNGHVRLVGERASVEAQLAGMIDLAARNSTWMQIAYSAADARDIILHGRLAVVLGVEADQLGTYVCGTPRQEVDYLWQLGVRVVTPIHAADNTLGGAAVFIGPYNWLNDLLHREIADMTKDDLQKYPPAYLDVAEATCETTDTTNDGECVQLRLEWNKQQRLYIGRCLESFFRLSPCLDRTPPVESYRTTRGHVNAKGLTPYGGEYLNALMDRGIMLDSAHMSDRSVHDTYAVVGARLERDHPECRGMSYAAGVPEGCGALAYPVSVSHAHFRAQAFYGEREFPPSEYDISNRNLELVRQGGGVVGPFVAVDRISTTWNESGRGEPFKNDCAFSSKSFGYAFHFARLRVGGVGVGMATDSTFIPQTAPRFGSQACWGFHLAINPDDEKRVHNARYAAADQTAGVLYQGIPVKDSVVMAPNAPLKPYRLGRRAFDFNVDGLANFGLVPDMLQDLKNLGLPPEDRQALFQSAEGYLRMWEQTAAAAVRSVDR